MDTMGKTLTIICVLALGVALAVPAYAEVQNIKVSGDIAVRSILRSNYDLNDDDTSTNGNDSEEYFMQSVGLNVDADLTDNVAATVRLVNQRDWDNNSSTGNTATFDVDMDLAYVTLKEMIYEPLTLKVGRQDLWFGRGLVVGANVQDFNNTINANEYTETTAFDAIRATLDYAPWTVDLVYSKIDENTISANDDVTLYGVNVGYLFDSYNAEAEAYYFGKIDSDSARANEGQVEVTTLGIRGSMEPADNLVVGAEGALQVGDYSDVNTANRDIEAYAINAYADYKMPDIKWSPTLGLELIYLTGEEDVDSSGTSKWNGWDAMYRGKFDTAIRDFQNYLYATSARASNVADTVWDQDCGLSNQVSLLVKGSITPMEDVVLNATYAHFWLEEDSAVLPNTDLKKDTDVGDEIDLLLTYDYTEDVSFGLLAAWFIPGNMFPTGQDDTAADVVGSMKIVF